MSVLRASTISDAEHDKIQRKLAAALILLYAGHARETANRLGHVKRALTLGDKPAMAINDFATDRAGKIQRGVNKRLEMGADVQTTKREMAGYTHVTLIPFMTAWTLHQARKDVYFAVPSPSSEGYGDWAASDEAITLGDTVDGSIADTEQWEWVQRLDFPDECAEAADASPASYQELFDIGGGDPPVHEHCLCTLDVVGVSAS